MNYQPKGLFQGMSQEDMVRIYHMIQQRQQQQPMLTGPMMLAQANPNQLQQMLGVRGDGVSAQTKAGIEAALPGFYGTKEQAKPSTSYTPGSDAFKGGRTLRTGYEQFGPMNDAEFESLMRMRRKK